MFIGDIVDNHAISYHESDPDGLSPGDEYEAAKAAVRPWYRAFPEARVCIGNHDKLPYRKAKTIGVSSHMMRDYSEIWDTPGWQWAEAWIDEYSSGRKIKYVHGINSAGKDGAYNRALKSRMSIVMGHAHSYAGVKPHASDDNLIFGMNVGCGVDQKAYSFEYAKDFPDRFILGCGVVISPEEMYFVPMDMGGRYHRNRNKRRRKR